MSEIDMNNNQSGSTRPNDVAISGVGLRLKPDRWNGDDFDHFESALEQIFDRTQATTISTQIQASELIGLMRHAYVRLRSGDSTDARRTLERALASADCGLTTGNAQFAAHMVNPGASAKGSAEHAGRNSPSASTSHSQQVLVRTLGTFQVLVNGKNISLKRKPPYRLLSLLKVLIANGGCAVSQSAMSDALWPDLDGDHACDAQQIALHRLRTLLGSREALLVTHGSVSLNVQFVRVDAFFLESLCRDAFAGGNQQRARVALELYRGPFLPDEIDSPWTTRMRDCLRAKFVNIIATAAAELESNKDYIGAAALYEQAIAIDDLENLLHHGLVRSLRRIGPRPRAVSRKTRVQIQSPH
jgi:DNA-binding SARP family transcriptional activator